MFPGYTVYANTEIETKGNGSAMRPTQELCNLLSGYTKRDITFCFEIQTSFKHVVLQSVSEVYQPPLSLPQAPVHIKWCTVRAYSCW